MRQSHLVIKLDDISPLLLLGSTPRIPTPCSRTRLFAWDTLLQQNILDDAQTGCANATAQPTPRTSQLLVLLDDALECYLRRHAVHLAYAVRAARCGQVEDKSIAATRRGQKYAAFSKRSHHRVPFDT